MLNSLKVIWQDIKSWWLGIEQIAKKDVSDIWANYKALIIPLVAVGVLIKFRDILISILVSSAKRLYTNSEKKSQDLQNQENKNNQKADDLINQANDLPKEEKPVSDDWYKNS